VSIHNSINPDKTVSSVDTDKSGFDACDVSSSDDVFEVIDEFLHDIEEAATDDEIREVVTDYLDTVSDLSLWEYSFNNQGSILSQMLYREDVDFAGTATHFAGFSQWIKDHGRHVKEGERGFKIIAPEKGPVCPECGKGPGYHVKYDYMDCEKAGTHPDDWDVDPEKEWKIDVWYYKTVTVFAYEQTSPLDDANEEDIFEPADWDTKGDATGLKSKLIESATDEFDITVTIESPSEYTGRNGSKGYTQLNGHVFIRDRKNTADVCSTLIHEIAHELIHSEDDEETEREKEEVEAECVAYAVCRYFGLDANNSAFYVSRWNGDESNKLRGRFKRIQRTAAKIIDAVEARS